MCIIFFVFDNEKYKLVIASNREEYLDRSTLAAHKHITNGKTAISGIDEVAGGTWLGITAKRFAFVTNFKEPPRYLKSRGDLVQSWLGELDLDDLKTYNGFNLVCGDYNGNVLYLTNRGNPEKACLVPATVYSMTNNTMYDTLWERQEKGNPIFKSLVENENEDIASKLFAMLDDLKVDPFLLDGHLWGTRQQTIVLVDHGGNIQYIERTLGGETVKLTMKIAE
jgi:uncharacterized protein with NRDE domain